MTASVLNVPADAVQQIEFERLGGDVPRGGEVDDAADHGGIVSAEHAPSAGAVSTAAQQARRESKEVLVHIPLAGKRARGRLLVGSFHQADCGGQRQEGVEISLRSVQVSLQA